MSLKGKSLFALALSIGLALPAIAQEQAADDAAEQRLIEPEQAAQSPSEEQLDDDPGDEIICRRERATGSLTRVRRICMTRNEWNGVYDDARDAHNSTTRGASGSQCIPDNPLRPSC